VVMLPLSMMTSLVGRVLGSFAVTTLIVNAVSILVSFTLTPILCAMLLQSASQRKNNVFARFGKRWDAKFQVMAVRYTQGIRNI
ncbi:efflux RND transporter permease subunit, partial [Escherichia coli]